MSSTDQPLSEQRIKWEIVPPHGTRFVNNWGSNVTLEFEPGRELEVMQAVVSQLQAHYVMALPKPQERAITPKPTIEGMLEDITKEEGNNGESK